MVGLAVGWRRSQAVVRSVAETEQVARVFGIPLRTESAT